MSSTIWAVYTANPGVTGITLSEASGGTFSPSTPGTYSVLVATWYSSSEVDATRCGMANYSYAAGADLSTGQLPTSTYCVGEITFTGTNKKLSVTFTKPQRQGIDHYTVYTQAGSSTAGPWNRNAKTSEVDNGDGTVTIVVSSPGVSTTSTAIGMLDKSSTAKTYTVLGDRRTSFQTGVTFTVSGGTSADTGTMTVASSALTNDGLNTLITVTNTLTDNLDDGTITYLLGSGDFPEYGLDAVALSPTIETDRSPRDRFARAFDGSLVRRDYTYDTLYDAIAITLNGSSFSSGADYNKLMKWGRDGVELLLHDYSTINYMLQIGSRCKVRPPAESLLGGKTLRDDTAFVFDIIQGAYYDGS